MNISVVVPVYNSESTLPILVDSLESVLAQISDSYEIILVNDGSRDNSWQVILDLLQTHSSVRGICLMRNFGQHNALLCGIRECKYEVTVTLDDDLQNPPSEIPKLLDKLNEGHDVVYGVPLKQEHSLLRTLASKLTKLILQKAMGAETARNIYPFRIFRTYVRDAFCTYRGPYVFIDVMLTWGTSKFASVKVEHHPRLQSKSNYTFIHLVTHALNLLTGFSTLPLRIASLNGFVFILFGMIAMAYVLITYVIHGGSVPGFAFLVCLMIIFSGANLLALGIIGEYLARMYVRIIDRPAYVVRTDSSSVYRSVNKDYELGQCIH